MVSQVVNNLSHAGDGTLLHLLVDVSCLQPLQSTREKVLHVRLGIKSAGFVQWPDNFHKLLSNQQGFGSDLIKGVSDTGHNRR